MSRSQAVREHEAQDTDALRFRAACEASESAGAALLHFRGRPLPSREAVGGQLKMPIDVAAEAWVLGYLASLFPQDRFLAEEAFESSSRTWDAPPAYWTVDALDGTRSFIEGFDGFCVQVAYVEQGEVRFGVVYEPVRAATYAARKGQGAWVAAADGQRRSLMLNGVFEPQRPIVVDSRRPAGAVGALLTRFGGDFLECGSYGVKICRVAEGSAHLLAKPGPFKLWDVAPGDLILREAGGRLGLWSGEPIVYDQPQVVFENLLAATPMLFEMAVVALRGEGRSVERVPQ